MTNDGKYAEIIFTTKGQNQESDKYSDPNIIKINVQQRISNYKATNDYIATIQVNYKTFFTIESDETIEELIDNRLYLIEKTEVSVIRKSLTFLLKQNNLDDTLGYLKTSEENFSFFSYTKYKKHSPVPIARIKLFG